MFAPLKPPLFPLGQIKIDESLAKKVPDAEIREAIQRHVRGDWGELMEEGKARNDREVREFMAPGNVEIVSLFTSKDGVKFYVSTEGEKPNTYVRVCEHEQNGEEW